MDAGASSAVGRTVDFNFSGDTTSDIYIPQMRIPELAKKLTADEVVKYYAEGAKLRKMSQSYATTDTFINVPVGGSKIPMFHGLRRNIKPGDLTFSRLMAAVAYRAIDSKINIQTNPLAMAVGLTPDHGIMFKLYVPSYEYLFFKYPKAVAALHVSRLKIEGDTEMLSESLMRQKTGGTSAAEYIAEHAAEIKQQVVTLERSSTRQVNIRKMADALNELLD